MTGVNLIDFLRDLDSRSVDECLEAYRAARKREEEERRAQFVVFGLPADLSCPASRLYHLHSCYSHDTELPLSDEESAALVRTFDYKRYAGATQIALPGNLSPLEVSLEKVIRGRRSRNKFSEGPISLEEVSRLLALSCGVTHQGELPRRAAPSAGALYPLEVYPWVFAVDHVPSGLYHYAPLDHVLEFVKPLNERKDLWPLLDSGCQGATPAAAFILTARLPRVQAKYGERGYRFALMESGHIAQNLLLSGTALGLNALPAGGFFDAGLRFLLGIDGEQEVAVYVILVGKP